MCLFFEPGVRFPDDSGDDVQKQKQLLKDAAAFLVSCQIPSLVSVTHSNSSFFFSFFSLFFNLSSFDSRTVHAHHVFKVKDCLDHSALPMDGATLTEALHQRGINVRYLGSVLQFVDKTPAKAQLEHFYVSVETVITVLNILLPFPQIDTFFLLLPLSENRNQ